MTVFEIWQFRHILSLLFLSTNLAFQNMLLQSFAEVGHANASVNDCAQDQYNGDDRETGQVLPDW